MNNKTIKEINRFKRRKEDLNEKSSSGVLAQNNEKCKSRQLQ